jgi:hypothetical protein
MIYRCSCPVYVQLVNVEQGRWTMLYDDEKTQRRTLLIWAVVALVVLLGYFFRYDVVAVGDDLYKVNRLTGTTHRCSIGVCVELSDY